MAVKSTKKSRPITTLTPWYGGNRTLAENVGEALSGRKWVAVPFAGGMCELRYIRASTILVNDMHRHVVNLAEVVADPKLGSKLIRRLRRTIIHPDVLAQSQKYCDAIDGGGLHNVASENWAEEWAYRYFISAWMGRNGKAGTKGEFKAGMSVRYDAGGGDSAIRFRSATEALLEWNRILRRCTFSTLDAFTMFGKFKDDPQCGVYVDPPFPGPGDHYAHTFGEAGQRKLAAELSRFEKTRVVCRFYDHELIRELYPARLWQWNFQTGRKQTHEMTNEEVLLINLSSL